ncbi:MAG: helix-turn-helix domain-containing protein [Betaproteobacteria bacterium]
MNESSQDDASPSVSAGALLRTARERCGMHIGLLATTLKVPVRKLELLESDRFDELHDATFVRALSLSVCRALKCDPAPVLAALPRQKPVVTALDQVNRGMNAPFSQRPGAQVVLRSVTGRRGWWAAGLLLVLAGAMQWVPGSWSPGSADTSVAPAGPAAPGSLAQTAGASAPDAGPAAGVPSPNGLVQTVHGAPVESGASAAAGMASTVTVTEPSWVEAADLQGRTIWTRTLTPGEVVALEGSAGLRLTIGNAAGTQVRWRGQTVDLAGGTRDNVARVELK